MRLSQGTRARPPPYYILYIRRRYFIIILVYFRRSRCVPSPVIIIYFKLIVYNMYTSRVSRALLFRIDVIGVLRNAYGVQCTYGNFIILNFLHTYVYCTRPFHCKHYIYTKITQYNNII